MTVLQRHTRINPDSPRPAPPATYRAATARTAPDRFPQTARNARPPSAKPPLSPIPPRWVIVPHQPPPPETAPAAATPPPPRCADQTRLKTSKAATQARPTARKDDRASPEGRSGSASAACLPPRSSWSADAGSKPPPSRARASSTSCVRNKAWPSSGAATCGASLIRDKSYHALPHCQQFPAFR